MQFGNMRLLLCAYKIYYYETISLFSKKEQNESHASTDFVYLCSSRYYTVVILIIMSIIIIFLEAKAMYKIIFKDICFVNESCSMYFYSICNIFFLSTCQFLFVLLQFHVQCTVVGMAMTVTIRIVNLAAIVSSNLSTTRVIAIAQVTLFMLIYIAFKRT